MLWANTLQAGLVTPLSGCDGIVDCSIGEVLTPGLRVQEPAIQRCGRRMFRRLTGMSVMRARASTSTWQWMQFVQRRCGDQAGRRRGGLTALVAVREEAVPPPQVDP